MERGVRLLQKCGVISFFENCANNQSPQFLFPRRGLGFGDQVPGEPREEHREEKFNPIQQRVDLID